MMKLDLPIKPKKEDPLAPPVTEYPGCDREIPSAQGVPPTSRLGCADTCKYGGHCQRERELLK